MIHNKFCISDHHFFHANILKFTNKEGVRIRDQFPTSQAGGLEVMHEYMVEKWNSVVKPQDYVYHLGDVTFDYGPRFNELMSRLQGKKRLIVGNHDKIWNPNLMRWFEKAFLWKGFKEYNLTLSHMPLKEGSFRDGAYNGHGHTHGNVLGMPYINLCVETRDYTPVSFEQIAKEIKCAS